MQLLTLCLALLLSASLAAGAVGGGLHQTKRADVVRREKWAKLLRPRQVASPIACDGPNDPACPEGYQCIIVPDTGCECEPNLPRKRTAADRRGGLFVPRDDFPGVLLSASEVAAFLLGDGQWQHRNGSLAVDYAYKTKSEVFRNHFWWNPPKKIRRAIALSGLSKFTAKTLAWHIVEGFQDPDEVLVISEAHGAHNHDIIRIAKALLAIPDWDEVFFWNNIVPRPALEGLIETVCPEMGPEYCDEEEFGDD